MRRPRRVKPLATIISAGLSKFGRRDGVYARELFADRGLGVTLNDIAHHAGVGVGTVYRRFPDKKQLIDGLFEQRLEDLVALMDIAVADPDPWRGLSGFLEHALELQAADRGLRELITGMPDGLERVEVVLPAFGLDGGPIARGDLGFDFRQFLGQFGLDLDHGGMGWPIEAHPCGAPLKLEGTG